MREIFRWCVVEDGPVSSYRTVDVGDITAFTDRIQAEEEARYRALSRGGTYLVFRMAPHREFRRATEVVESTTVKERRL